MTDDLEHCFVCGCEPTQIHHVFFGRNRKNSDADGFVVGLCMDHHTGSRNGVHGQNTALRLALMRAGQVVYEKNHTREEFIERYGKSYL